MTNKSTLLERARALGLSLSPESAVFDQSGLDFFALLAQDEKGVAWVVRTPRHPNAWAGAVHEASVLRFIQGRLPAAVPHWRIFEQDLIAYPKLPGTPAWSYDPEKGVVWNGVDPLDPQENFLRSSAKFLVQLHAVDLKALQAATGRSQSIDDVRRKISEAVEATKDILSPSPATLHRWQSWVGEDEWWPAQTLFVHGDLHPGHMLLADDLTLRGVLDWTEAGPGDPSVDFAIFYGCFGAPCLEKMLQYYAEAGGACYGKFAAHVAERWAAYAPLVAFWGLTNNNQDVIAHARQQLAAAETSAT